LAELRRYAVPVGLRDRERKNATVEIMPDIIVVQLHQKAVPEVVRFLNRRRAFMPSTM
jgi:hypothetical protein